MRSTRALPATGDEIRVRTATTADAAVVSAFIAELGRPRLREDPTAQLAVFDRYLTEPDRVILIAEVGQLAVGVVSLCVRDRLNWPTPEAWIPDLVVARSARRRGVGEALIGACADRARARSCHVLRLECGFEREAAHPFYEAAGFSRTGYVYRLDVSAAEEDRV